MNLFSFSLQNKNDKQNMSRVNGCHLVHNEPNRTKCIILADASRCFYFIALILPQTLFAFKANSCDCKIYIRFLETLVQSDRLFMNYFNRLLLTLVQFFTHLYNSQYNKHQHPSTITSPIRYLKYDNWNKQIFKKPCTQLKNNIFHMQ